MDECEQCCRWMRGLKQSFTISLGVRLATLHSDTSERHLCLKELISKIQMGFLQPRAFLLSLSFTAHHCEANWKGSLLIKASVEVGSVTQPELSAQHSALAYGRQTPLLRSCVFAMLPRWSQTRCCGLGRHSARDRICPESSVITGPQVERRLGHGPHILFELTTQVEWPVYNLHSRGRKLH